VGEEVAGEEGEVTEWRGGKVAKWRSGGVAKLPNGGVKSPRWARSERGTPGVFFGLVVWRRGWCGPGRFVTEAACEVDEDSSVLREAEVGAGDEAGGPDRGLGVRRAVGGADPRVAQAGVADEVVGRGRGG